jgi:hypothetical protein
MKLHSPSFEKDLRHEVKKAVRNSPALKKEYRQANNAFRKHLRIHWIAWLILSGVVGCGIWVIVKITGHVVTGLAAINLLTLFLAANYVRSLPLVIFHATDLPALSLLPLSESEVFRWELQKFFRRIAMFSLFAMFSGYGALGIYLHLSFVQWLGAAVLAILSWATLVALAALCAARFPKLPYPIFTASVYLFGFGLLLTWKVFGAVVLHFIDDIAPLLNLLLPTGWCPSLFQLLLPDGKWWLAILIVPVALIIWSLKSSLELLRGRLTYKEHVIPETPDQIPGMDPNASATKNGAAQPSPVQVGSTAIEEIIQTRQFLVQEPWDKRGWFEKLLWHWLDPREKTLAEFAFPRGFSITKPWKTVLRNFSVTVLAGFIAGMANLTLEFWVFGVGLVITFLHALALILGNGAAFRSLLSSGVRMHIYAVYPITFRELSRTLFKASVVQLPMFIAYTMACAILISHLAGTPVGWGIIIGVKVGLLIFAARFITTTLAFSACTNDSTQFRLRTIVLAVLFVGLSCLFLALGGGSLFVSNAFIAWLLFLAAVFDAYALFRIYGWFHSRNKFDLMNFAQR